MQPNHEAILSPVTCGPGGSWRLFVAVPVPVPVQAELARAARELSPWLAPAAMRWVNPEQYHLTLKFMGNVPIEKVDKINALVSVVCASAGAFALRAHGLGFFPSREAPRVVWAGVETENMNLAELQRELDQKLAPLAGRPAVEPFHPHITLGRFQKYRRKRLESWLPAAESMGRRCWGAWTATSVSLCRSELTSNGARHTVLASHRLMSL